MISAGITQAISLKGISVIRVYEPKSKSFQHTHIVKIDKFNFLKDLYPLVSNIESNLRDGCETLIYWDDDYTDIDHVSRIEMLRLALIMYRDNELHETCCDIYSANMKKIGGRDHQCYLYHEAQLDVWGEMVKQKYMDDAESEYQGYLQDAGDGLFELGWKKENGQCGLYPYCAGLYCPPAQEYPERMLPGAIATQNHTMVNNTFGCLDLTIDQWISRRSNTKR